MKASLLRFLNEVYFETELEVAGVGTDPAMIKLLRNFDDELNAIPWGAQMETKEGVKEEERQRILHGALNGPLERAGSEHRVVSLLGEEALRGFAHYQDDTHVLGEFGDALEL